MKPESESCIAESTVNIKYCDAQREILVIGLRQQKKRHISFSLVRWVLVGQLVLTAVLAGMAGLVGGIIAAASLAVGGLIGFVANLAYVWQAMRAEFDPGRVLRTQMLAEIYKVGITVMLFALVFANSKSVAAVPLFLGYGTTFVVHWLAMLRRNQEIGDAGRS